MPWIIETDGVFEPAAKSEYSSSKIVSLRLRENEAALLFMLRAAFAAQPFSKPSLTSTTMSLEQGAFVKTESFAVGSIKIACYTSSQSGMIFFVTALYLRGAPTVLMNLIAFTTPRTIMWPCSSLI